jgi:hypothetical protein
MNSKSQAETLKEVMNRYNLTCKDVAGIFKVKTYTIWNFRQGNRMFRKSDLFFLLHKLAKIYQEYLTQIDEDVAIIDGL